MMVLIDPTYFEFQVRHQLMMTAFASCSQCSLHSLGVPRHADCLRRTSAVVAAPHALCSPCQAPNSAAASQIRCLCMHRTSL